MSTAIELHVITDTGSLMCMFADRCNSTQFHCSRGNSCISAEQECDGFTNCNDTSDEAICCMLFR